jgi:hypothetical protein
VNVEVEEKEGEVQGKKKRTPFQLLSFFSAVAVVDEALPTVLPSAPDLTEDAEGCLYV